VIELQQISKAFGGCVALDDVSLSLKPGERLALVGENGAGKSSLMNVLYGLYQPDAGRVLLEGVPVRLASPREAIARGIGMVHQHFMLVPSLTVAENVVLGAEPTRAGIWLDLSQAAREVSATAARLGFAVDPHAKVESLTVGAQQRVEIVKALFRGARTLILDEPTAVLTPQEAEELFEVVRQLSAAGHGVVIITHKLREVFAVATRIAVMRRGRKVAEVAPGETNEVELARLMVGDEGAEAARAARELGGIGISLREASSSPAGSAQREASPLREVSSLRDASSLVEVPARDASPPRAAPTLLSGSDRQFILNAVALEARGASGRPALRKVSLSVRAGEIVGIAGVDGNGQRELVEVLAGLRSLDGGRFQLDMLNVERHGDPGALRRAGLSHIPEDRLHQAVVTSMSVEENISLGRQAQAPFARGRLGWLDFRGRRARAEQLISDYQVRPTDPGLPLGALSGGNQQKVVVARELDAQPKLLLAVQPTRGLDLGAVAQVHSRLRAQRDRGGAVLLISLDLEEVLALSDRLYVMSGGAVTAELRRSEFDVQAIGRAMLAHGAANG
jgi:ABC-type uncharacterized transport system ATPase subunit